MPYTTKNPPDWLENLPAGAIKIGVDTFNAVLDDTDDEDKARKAAWAAIKREYKKEGDKWVKKEEKSEATTELPALDVLRASPCYHQINLVISKAASKGDGRVRWQLTASTTDTDSRGDRTTLELFNDWVNRIISQATVEWLPTPQQPFLGLAHYPALDGIAVAGDPERLFIDGNRFKSDGFFNSSEVGQAAAAALQDERAAIKQGETVEDPIRISAAWWDICHAHDGYVFVRQSLLDECPVCMVLSDQSRAREFKQGQLDHFALTRVPVNPATDIGLLEQKSDGTTVTRLEDAASIIGPELAGEIEAAYRKRAQPGKSAAPALATRADADESPAPVSEGEPESQTESDPAELTEASYWYPLDGATSFEDAEAFLADNDKFNRLLSQWDIFTVITNNLLDMLWDGVITTKDAIPLFKAAVQDFSERVAVVQSTAVKAFLTRTDAPKERKEITMSGQVPEQPTPAVPDQTPAADETPAAVANVVAQSAAQQPEQDAYSLLRETVNAALNTPNLTRQARLEQIQNGLTACAGAIEDEIESTVGPDLAESVSTAVATAIENALAPLAQQISQFMAVQQEQSKAIAAAAAGQSPQQLMVPPVQKSVSAPPSLVVAAGPEGQAAVPISPITGKPSPLTAIIQRSVGIRR